MAAIRLLTRNVNTVLQGQRCYAIGGGRQAAECMESAPGTDVSKLGNEVQVATENNGMPTCTVGVYVKAGSRYDQAPGAANFFEHMMYRGTEKRTGAQLEEELTSIGAKMSSFTERDNAAVYVKCLASQVDKAVELLADVVNNGKLDDSSINAEKARIHDCLANAEKCHQTTVMDYLHRTAYQGTPLAHSILGTGQSVADMTAADLKLHHRNNYQGHRMALVSSGGVTHDKLLALGEKHFASQHNGDASALANGTRFTGSEMLYNDHRIPLCYGAIAVETVGNSHEDSLALSMGALLLGSWDRSCLTNGLSPNKLARRLAERAEIESFYAFFNHYEDTGLFGVYGTMPGTAHLYYTQCVMEHMKELCVENEDIDMVRGRNMLKTQLMAGLQGTTNSAHDIGRQVLAMGQRVPLRQIVNRIDSITAEDMNDVFMRHVYDRDIAVAAIGQTEAHTDYNTLRKRMTYWRM